MSAPAAVARRSARVLAVLLLAAPASRPAALPAQQTARPEPGEPRDFRLPEPRTFALDNGMGVTLVPYGVLPKATVRLVVRSGNLDEAADQVWLADLAGDLLEEGTTTRSGQEVAEAAAAMGGSLAVGTGLDQSFVQGDVLSEFVPDFVRLVADVARNPAFPEGELPRLKADRIRQLTVARSQPQQIALEKLRAELYGDHPYGRLLPTEEMLRGYTVAQVRAFHAENWGGRRSHLYVVGVFDATSAEAAAREAFGGWRDGPDPRVDVPAPESRRRVFLVDRPGAAQSTVYIAVPVVDPSHVDYVALELTDLLLGGAFTSRITRNIREDKGYTYSPFSALSSRYRDSYWVQVADVTTEVTGAALDEIFAEIERLRAETPPSDEVEGIRNYRAGVFVLQNSTRGGIASQLGFVRLHGLAPDHLETYVGRVHGVAPERIREMAEHYLVPDRMTIVVVGDRERIAEQVARFGTVF